MIIQIVTIPELIGPAEGIPWGFAFRDGWIDLASVSPERKDEMAGITEGHTTEPLGPPAPPLPEGLPVPLDDGAADHLVGMQIPEVTLASTKGPWRIVDHPLLVLFVFPRIGRPDEPNPPGWDQIPGARGCTQQTCAYRDLYREFLALGYEIASVSAQPLQSLLEASDRLHVPYPMASDPERVLATELGLPTLDAAGETLYRRLSLVVQDRRIRKVFYPVFPPQDNAPTVLSWLAR
jgi:peroxiredoxin